MKRFFNLFVFFLGVSALMSLTGCMEDFDETTRQQLLSAKSMNMDADSRYGLEKIKLGDSRDSVMEELEKVFGKALKCDELKTGLGAVRRAFSLEKCDLMLVEEDGDMKVPVQQSDQLWNEKVQRIRTAFLDNKLILLELQFDSKGISQKELAEKHGKKGLELFGKPESIEDKSFVWVHQDDRVTLALLENSKICLHISNDKVLQGLHHTGTPAGQSRLDIPLKHIKAMCPDEKTASGDTEKSTDSSSRASEPQEMIRRD